MHLVAGLAPGAIFDPRGQTASVAFPDMDRVRACRDVSVLQSALLHAISLLRGAEIRSGNQQRMLEQVAQLSGDYDTISEAVDDIRRAMMRVLTVATYAAGAAAGGAPDSAAGNVENTQAGEARHAAGAGGESSAPFTITAHRIQGPSLRYSLYGRGASSVQLMRYDVQVSVALGVVFVGGLPWTCTSHCPCHHASHVDY